MLCIKQAQILRWSSAQISVYIFYLIGLLYIGSRTQTSCRRRADTGWCDGPVAITHLISRQKKKGSGSVRTAKLNPQTNNSGWEKVFCFFLIFFFPFSCLSHNVWRESGSDGDHHEPEVHRLQERRRAQPVRDAGGGEPAVRGRRSSDTQRRRGGGGGDRRCRGWRGGGGAER